MSEISSNRIAPGQADAPEKCAVCGALLRVDDLAGQCPACMLDLADSEMKGAGSEPLLPNLGPPTFVRDFGDYRLKRQIGRGGMGVVYEAEQISVRRKVALKMVLETHVASPMARRRFS